MTIKEQLLNSDGTWVIKYNNNYKIVVNFKKKCFDTFDWFNVYGTLDNELTEDKTNELLKNIKECKKIK